MNKTNVIVSGCSGIGVAIWSHDWTVGLGLAFIVFAIGVIFSSQSED